MSKVLIQALAIDARLRLGTGGGRAWTMIAPCVFTFIIAAVKMKLVHKKPCMV
jgi:hypothetical protein